MLEKLFRFIFAARVFIDVHSQTVSLSLAVAGFLVGVLNPFCVCVYLLHIAEQPSCTVTVGKAHGAGHLCEFYTHFWELVLRFSSYNSSKLQILLYLYNPLCVDFIFYIFVFIIYFSDQVLGWFCRLLIIGGGGVTCVCACCLA